MSILNLIANIVIIPMMQVYILKNKKGIEYPY